jgi:hypothetical protein
LSPFNIERAEIEMKGMSASEATAIYASVPGGSELLEWFGEVPWFHDAEVLSLELHRRGESRLRVFGWITRNVVVNQGYSTSARHAIVTFSIRGVSDLQLDGFNQQNVLGNLFIHKRGKDTERAPYYDFCAKDDDFEIILEPCYGLDGRIRCNELSISFIQGRPTDQSYR